MIDLHLTWQKLMLAARVLVTIENPQDILVVSTRPFGQRAVLKFAHYTGAHCLAGRYASGGCIACVRTCVCGCWWGSGHDQAPGHPATRTSPTIFVPNRKYLKAP